VSLKDNRFSPLYRPGQAFREEPGRLPAVAVCFLAVGGAGILLSVVSDGWAGVLGTVLFLLGMVVGGGTYTAIQLRAVHRRTTARSRATTREDRSV
jgi:uncharacterized protein (DUF58 family)